MPRNAMMPTIVAAVLVAALAGCAHPGRPVIVETIDRVVLQSEQYAIDTNGSGTPDAVAVQLMMYSHSGEKIKAVLGSGLTEIDLFQGSAYAPDGSRNKPLFTWKLTQEDMAPFVARPYGLFCYRMVLSWPRDIKVTGESVTIQASYINPAGNRIYGQPTEILLKLGR